MKQRSSTTYDEIGSSPWDWYPYYPPYEPAQWPWVVQQLCPKCNELVDCGDRYCRHCGHQFYTPKYCPHCGKEI